MLLADAHRLGGLVRGDVAVADRGNDLGAQVGVDVGPVLEEALLDVVDGERVVLADQGLQEARLRLVVNTSR